MELSLAWLFGWLAMTALHHHATRRRVVINPREASYWQLITHGDIDSLRQVKAPPLEKRKGSRLVLTDRGC